ncbi:putative helicase mov-10-B.2 [Cyprinus carpio]|uniref:RNA helicase n=1 Tax=Cyprinus carpio TaxID=7962 RepID=A0A9Q9YDN7_CYPCA|nr:putative helicase mov-10-B.2 [Cyprinus carpio]
MNRRNRNNYLSIAAVRAIGLDFIEMLEETNRRSITDRNTLRDIYNEEFRDRDGLVKDPNFSRVIFALRKDNKARLFRSGRHVYFNTNVRVRLHDQWFRNCRRRQNQASPAPAFSATSGQDASVPGPEGGVRGRRRLAKDILQRLNSTERSFFITDKYGVRVSSGLRMEDGKIQICVDRAEVYELKMFVENTGQEAVYFTYYTALCWLQYFTLEDSRRVTRNNPLRLEPREKYEVTVRFKSSHVGVYSATLAFEFKQNTQPTTLPFHIVRFIEVEYRTKLAALLGPTEPFKPLRLNIFEPENCKVDEGVPPEGYVQNFLENVLPLGQYTPPPHIPELAKLLKDGCSSRILRGKFQELQSLLQSPLGFHNYAERFDLLLYLEECQMHVDIKRYNRDQVTLFKDSDKRLMVLNLPGVSENRPSVLRGDHLLLTKCEEVQLSTVTKYKGFVHKVELDRVKLGFSRRYDFLDHVYVEKMKFRVEFTVNRLPLRLQHRAVHMAVQHELRDVLFPVGSRDVTPASPPALRLFNQHLERNPEQYSAVCHIVAGTSKPAPYLVFGPPGTGKTVTIVEAIKQVEKNMPDAYILACAPSNSAADQLCEKLITSQHVDSRKIYRLYASSRDPKYIPEVLKNNSNLEGEMLVFPCKEDLMCYKILVSTLVTTGRLVSGGFPVDHFSHIFVDEAGHAIESETIISVAGLLNAENGQLVLAGDPRQLGPTLRSPLAINHGLDISLLERLMTQNDLYKKDNMEFDKRYVTKLLLNYRSHPSILKVPNELFYDGELVACANEISSNQYCTWEHLPKRGFPVIFHGVPGKDERESNSPSFFNIYEIEIIIGYLKKLLLTQAKKGISRISPRDIGIIAPYRKQVEKIKWAIGTDEDLQNYMCIKDLKVGSVEEFQGQERKVILVSAVRSSKEHIIFDEPFNIGFLKNEKRFNVAVTRAKALFIMVGNPTILRTDETWGRFIDFCFEQGGYTGLPFISAEGIEEVEKCLLALNIQDERVETEESAVQQYVHPEWRHDY